MSCPNARAGVGVVQEKKNTVKATQISTPSLLTTSGWLWWYQYWLGKHISTYIPYIYFVCVQSAVCDYLFDVSGCAETLSTCNSPTEVQQYRRWCNWKGEGVFGSPDLSLILLSLSLSQCKCEAAGWQLPGHLRVWRGQRGPLPSLHESPGRLWREGQEGHTRGGVPGK